MDVAAHEYMDTPVGRAPYDVPADVQADPYEYASPYESLSQLVAAQNVYLERIADASEAQRQTPRLTQVNLTATPFSTTVALRSEFIVISVSAACTVTLTVGSAAAFVFNFAGADIRTIPYVQMIGRGVDLSITVSAGTGSAYLLAYPE